MRFKKVLFGLAVVVVLGALNIFAGGLPESDSRAAPVQIRYGSLVSIPIDLGGSIHLAFTIVNEREEPVLRFQMNLANIPSNMQVFAPEFVGVSPMNVEFVPNGGVSTQVTTYLAQVEDNGSITVTAFTTQVTTIPFRPGLLMEPVEDHQRLPQGLRLASVSNH